MRVDVFGNSHVGYFVGKYMDGDKEEVLSTDSLDVIAFKAGVTGATVKGIDNDHSATEAGRKFKQRYAEGVENLVIVLGDVDARYHFKQEESTPARFADLLVEKLVFFVDNSISKPPRRVVLFGCVPFTRDSLHGSATDANGSSAQFVMNMINHRMKSIAGERHDRGWRYLSVFKEIVGDDGFLDENFAQSHDRAHCNFEKMPGILLPKLTELLA